jgi:hypothetical protein
MPFVALVAALFLPALAVGQCPPPPPTSDLLEGQIGLFFDPLGTMTCADPVAGVIPLYLVARVPEGGIAEFEIPVVESIYEYWPVGSSSLPPDSPFDTVVYADACSHAVRPDPMTCPVAAGDLLVIAVVEITVTTPVIGAMCFYTACPTIAGTVQKHPSFKRCDTDVWEDLGPAYFCLGFGEPYVRAETSTWGAVKSMYRE